MKLYAKGTNKETIRGLAGNLKVNGFITPNPNHELMLQAGYSVYTPEPTLPSPLTNEGIKEQREFRYSTEYQPLADTAAGYELDGNTEKEQEYTRLAKEKREEIRNELPYITE